MTPLGFGDFGKDFDDAAVRALSPEMLLKHLNGAIHRAQTALQTFEMQRRELGDDPGELGEAFTDVADAFANGFMVALIGQHIVEKQ